MPDSTAGTELAAIRSAAARMPAAMRCTGSPSPSSRKPGEDARLNGMDRGSGGPPGPPDSAHPMSIVTHLAGLGPLAPDGGGGGDSASAIIASYVLAVPASGSAGSSGGVPFLPSSASRRRKSLAASGAPPGWAPVSASSAPLSPPARRPAASRPGSAMYRRATFSASARRPSASPPAPSSSPCSLAEVARIFAHSLTGLCTMRRQDESFARSISSSASCGPAASPLPWGSRILARRRE